VVDTHDKTIGNFAGSGAEYRKRAQEEATRRASATNILTPHEASTGQWDASKALKTTLGGVKRDITGEDLRAFAKNVKALTGRYAHGITAKQVIDFSLPNRRERARKEIHIAIPVYGSTVTAKNESSLVVRFMTNAGPECKNHIQRHHVHVQFMSFNAAVNAFGMDNKKAAQWLRREKIKFDCDCEDHTYRFRYIASTGKFAYGRVETGFPKERNPLLQGVACKHVIRVMQQIDGSPMALNFLIKMIDKARKHNDGKAIGQETQKGIDAKAKRQLARQAQIKTSEQKRQERLAAQSRKSAANAVKKAAQPKKKKPRSNRINNLGNADAREAALRAEMAKFGIEPTQEQIEKVRNSAQ
jgi:hypothetical protein